MMPYPFGYIWLIFHKIQNSGWAIYNKTGLPIALSGLADGIFIIYF